MRKSAFLFALFAALSIHAAGPANYAGNWTLDKAQSKDLPPYYENIKTHALKITQTDKELVLSVDIVSDSSDHFDFTYKLDGTPVQAPTKVRTPNGPLEVPTTMKAVAAENGELTITIERELPSRDGTSFKGTTVETWRLGADGKTLTIERADQMRSRSFNSTMVFTRS